MLAGNEREALLRVADQLGKELDYAGTGEIAGGDPGMVGENRSKVGVLGPEDELLVVSIRRRLARIAAALSSEGADDASESATRDALDGTELVIRGELLMGNAHQLPTLLPGFVFLVALPVVDQDRALEISRRAAELIEMAFG